MYKILERDEFGNPHEVIYTNDFRVYMFLKDLTITIGWQISGEIL